MNILWYISTYSLRSSDNNNDNNNIYYTYTYIAVMIICNIIL